MLPNRSCATFDSVPFVLATAARYSQSFRDGVLAAVNAGGDTDSNGAMVGAILGAAHGLCAIPEEWQRDVEDTTAILREADGLFEVWMR
ncbi:MAG: ADP-ribosylglycohydrolase family protein [Candidatus Uhrbacteria bacterium]